MYVNLLSTRVMGKVRAMVKGGVDPNYLTALFAVVDSPRFYPTCYPFWLFYYYYTIIIIML